MRALIYIAIFGVLFSCSDANKNEIMVESTADIVEETTAPAMASETFTYETILTQKTQELLDLKTLAHQFPEDKAVKEQLATITEAFDVSAIKGYEKVTAIETLAPLKRVNDSVQHLRISISTKGAQGETLKDSITAVITTRMFILDGAEQTATKIIFKN